MCGSAEFCDHRAALAGPKIASYLHMCLDCFGDDGIEDAKLALARRASERKRKHMDKTIGWREEEMVKLSKDFDSSPAFLCGANIMPMINAPKSPLRPANSNAL